MTKKEFYESLELFFAEVLRTIRRKNEDYSAGDDPFRNFMYAEELGIATAEAALLIRLSDKLTRMANLLKNPAQVQDEKFEDTAMDATAYSAILAMVRKSRK